MSADILNHQPAGPSTILPGHWLLDLPPNSAIQVRRYRVRTPALGELSLPTQDKSDNLGTAWREINSTGKAEIRSILHEPCAVICSQDDMGDVENVQGRELWCFRVKAAGDVWTAGDDLPGVSDDLEAILPDLPPIEPRQLLKCPRHGHELSCLLRPSTSQRPLKSCDVRFDPQGQDRLVWDKLAQAILEKMQWSRGKRVIAKRETRLRAQLYPAPSGLLLRVKSSPASKTVTDTNRQTASGWVTIDPLGLPARFIRPYGPDATEAEKLATSFELVLGNEWHRGQSAARIQAQLELRAFYPYTVLWVPIRLPDHDSSDQATVDQGVLTIWPTHLLSRSQPGINRTPRAHQPVPLLPQAAALDIMSAASGLFESMAAYQEPVPTPPADEAADGPSTPAYDDSQPGSPAIDPVPAAAAGEDDDDDLEDLFVSDTPARSPEMFQADQAFEMFGDRTDRRISLPDNAHLIDYGDVVMSSPPALERRESSRNGLNGADGLDEPEPAGVTEDDFNFFDSPVDEVPPAVEDTVAAKPALAETETAPAAPEEPSSAELVEATGLSDVTHANDAVVGDAAGGQAQPVEPTLVIVPAPESQRTEHNEEAIVALQQQETILSPLAPTKPDEPAGSTAQAPAIRVVKSRPIDHDLVPDPFAPLELATSKTTFTYSLPTPAPTPPNLNADLIERISSPKASKQTYDYASQWVLEAPPSELDEEEYTGPPTPMTDLDDVDVSTARATPALQNSAATGLFVFDGVQCVSTEWMALADDHGRLKQLARPWAASWGSTPPINVKSSTEFNAKKRKRPGAATDAKIDLDSLATQVICNRDLRRMLAELPGAEHNDDRLDSFCHSGATLADFVPEASLDTIESTNDAQPEDQPDGLLKQCNIHAGFQGNVIRLSIAALRYWRELDLQPVSGPKNLKAVVVNHGGVPVESLSASVKLLIKTYQSLGLGEITPDKNRESDLVASTGKQDAMSRALRWLAKQESAAVIFVMCNSIESSPLARYLGLAETDSLAPNQLIHFLPLAATRHRDIQYLARDLYDRVPRQIRPTDSVTAGNPAWFHFPAFTLCPESPPKPHLTLHWPIKSFDMFGSWRWVHAAYGYSSIQQAVIVFVADAEGENWQVKVIRDADPASWTHRVDAIWRFLRSFAQASAIEWRLSVCRLSLMDEAELHAWRDVFVNNTDPVSIMMTDLANPTQSLARPRNGPPNVPLGIINDPTTLMYDDSLAASYHAMPTRQPVSIGPGETTVYPESTILLSLNTPALEYATSSIHVLYKRPPPGKDDEVPEKVLATELYRASCWSRIKFGHDALPGHLASVHSVLDVLDIIAK